MSAAMVKCLYLWFGKEIYVAESDSKGGTLEGAMDGLKRGRKIYVRYPELKRKKPQISRIGVLWQSTWTVG